MSKAELRPDPIIFNSVFYPPIAWTYEERSEFVKLWRLEDDAAGILAAKKRMPSPYTRRHGANVTGYAGYIGVVNYMDVTMSPGRHEFVEYSSNVDGETAFFADLSNCPLLAESKIQKLKMGDDLYKTLDWVFKRTRKTDRFKLYFYRSNNGSNSILVIEQYRSFFFGYVTRFKQTVAIKIDEILAAKIALKSGACTISEVVELFNVDIIAP